MLLADADLRHDIGFAARSRILSMFTLEQSLAIFGDLYREVTGRITSAPVLERQERARESEHIDGPQCGHGTEPLRALAPCRDRKEIAPHDDTERHAARGACPTTTRCRGSRATARSPPATPPAVRR